jgi:hypothetical protein
MEPYSRSRRRFLAASTTAAAGVGLEPAFAESQDFAALTLKKSSGRPSSGGGSGAAQPLRQSANGQEHEYQDRRESFSTNSWIYFFAATSKTAL